MGLDWSFSTDRRMRRCPRQTFFADVAACHNARDPLRRECFLLSQLKGIEAWRGAVVHRAIQTFVVPCWQNHQPVAWDEVVQKARSLAERQFEFSSKRRHREQGMSKSKADGDYSALFAHEFQIAISEQQVAATLHGIESALWNLSGMDDFLKHVEGRSYYRSEAAVSAEYNGVRIKGQIDLIFARNYGEYAVVDWKDYENASNSDARQQMCLYAWLLCRSHIWRVNDPERIELWEIKLGEAKSVRHTITRDSFDELEDFMFRSTEQLRALCGDGIYRVADLENFPHTNNPNSCRFCSYARICREPEPWVTIASTSTKSKVQTSALLNIA